jgi:hypothetical protein
MKKIAVVLLLLLFGTGCQTRLLKSNSTLDVDANTLTVASNPMHASVLLVAKNSVRIGNNPVSLSQKHISGGGTVTVVNWNGQTGFLTAWHVVKNVRNNTIKVIGNDHADVLGPFIKLPNRDIAWYAASIPPEWRPIPVATNAQRYINVTTWGYPHTEDRLMSYPGTDNGAILLSGDISREIAGIAIPGMSGGPVISTVNGQMYVFAIVSHSSWPIRNEHQAAFIADLRP